MTKSSWQNGDYSETQKLQFLLKYLPRSNATQTAPSKIIPAKKIKSGVIVMGTEILSKNAEDFLTGAYNYGWVQDFDWPTWSQSEDAKALFEDPDALASATIEDITKVITTILRIDRQAGGRLADSFRSGLIARIALRAERLLEFAVMQSDQRPWPREYYDAMHHYFYAPDRLEHLSGPKENAKGRYERVMERLMRIEEPLNHIMGLFFAIAPSNFVHGLFADYCGLASSGQLRLLGRSTDKEFDLKNFSQPDFAFDGPDSFLTIEAKIDSKSGMDQLVKYAALHNKAALGKPTRKHALLFLSKEPQAKLFKEKIEGWKNIRDHAKAHLEKMPKKGLLKIDGEKTSAMIDKLKLGYISYSNFADALEKQSKLMRSSSNEEGEKLYLGLLFEMKRRLLC